MPFKGIKCQFCDVIDQVISNLNPLPLFLHLYPPLVTKMKSLLFLFRLFYMLFLEKLLAPHLTMPLLSFLTPGLPSLSSHFLHISQINYEKRARYSTGHVSNCTTNFILQYKLKYSIFVISFV